MLFGVAVFTLGVGLVVISPTYPALVISLVLVGASKIVFDPAMYAYVGDRVSYDRRGLAIAVGEFGWSGAFLLGIPIVGWLIARYGWGAPFPWSNAFHLDVPLLNGFLPHERWNAPFPWLALVGVGLIWLLWRMLPSDTPHAGSRPSLSKGVRTILAYPPALAGLAISILINASNESINIVYGLWMENSFGLQVVALGAASAVIGVAELGGEGLVAAFVDKLGKRRAVGGGLAFFAGACLLLPILGQTIEGALLGLFLFYLSYEFTLVATIPLMTELIPSARATLMAVNVAAFSVGRVIGSLIGPPLFMSGLPANAIVAAITILVALFLLIFIVREQPSATISPVMPDLQTPP